MTRWDQNTKRRVCSGFASALATSYTTLALAKATSPPSNIRYAIIKTSLSTLDTSESTMRDICRDIIDENTYEMIEDAKETYRSS